MKKNPSPQLFQKYLPYAILAGIFIIAIFFRFYKITSLPPALHPLEATFGNQALELLKSRHLPPVGAGAGNSPFIALQAVAILIFKTSLWSLRVAPALLGVVSVGLVYLLAKQWFGRRVGLLSAGLMAINPWIVTINRDALPINLVVMLIIATLLFATRAYRSKKLIWWLASALVLAITIYVYLPSLLLALGLGLLGLVLLLWRRRYLPDNKTLLITGAVFVLLLSPLAYFGITKHQQFSQNLRSSTILFNGKTADRTKLLSSNTADTALMFNVKGDENYQHNLGGLPLLNAFIGIMFLLGILVVLRHFKRRANTLIVVGAVALITPVIVGSGSMPDALGAIVVAPIAMAVSAIGIDYLLKRWYGTFPVNNIARIVGVALVMMLLSLSLYQGYKQYFVAWAQDPKTFASYGEPLTAMANYLNSEASARGLNADNCFVMIDPFSDQTIQFLTHDRVSYSTIDVNGLRNLPINKQPKIFLVAEQSDSAEQLEIISAKFPGGQVVSHYSNFDQRQLFFTYELSQ